MVQHGALSLVAGDESEVAPSSAIPDDPAVMPVVLLAGAPVAGRTTVLRRLVRGGGGGGGGRAYRIAALVQTTSGEDPTDHTIQSINRSKADDGGALIAHHGASQERQPSTPVATPVGKPTVSMTDHGSMFCSVEKGNFLEGIISVTQHMDPDFPLDAVILEVEAFGDVDNRSMPSEELMEQASAAAASTSTTQFQVGGLVAVVDATEVAAACLSDQVLQSKNESVTLPLLPWKRHAVIADTIVLSKIDLIGPDSVDEVIRYLRSLNPGAKVLPAVRGGVDLEDLLPPPPPPPPGAKGGGPPAAGAAAAAAGGGEGKPPRRRPRQLGSELSKLLFGGIERKYSWPIALLIDLRLMELLVLIFLLMNKDSFKPTEMNRISPPEIEVMIGEVPVSLTNSDHSFPLRVDGIWCTAADFEACEGILTSSGCCSAQHYEEIIPGTQLQWLLRYIPLIFILGRFFLLRLTKKMPVRIFFDSLVALFSTWLAVEITTGFLKNFVGYPRPNYYALRAYKRLNDGGSDGAANQSFPSSHASYSMGGMAFVALLLLQDWQHLRAPAQKGGPPRLPAGSLLPHLAASFPLAYAVFVAASRVRDHFHFPADVATGMALGLGAALFGLRCGGPLPPPPCPAKPLAAAAAAAATPRPCSPAPAPAAAAPASPTTAKPAPAPPTLPPSLPSPLPRALLGGGSGAQQQRSRSLSPRSPFFFSRASELGPSPLKKELAVRRSLSPFVGRRKRQAGSLSPLPTRGSSWRT